MGLQATICHICGAPCNHDQYVVDGEAGFAFTAAQDWLHAAVAIAILDEEPKVVHGKVVDSALESGDDSFFVCDGLGTGDYFAVHEACWKLAGSPKDEALFEWAPHTDGWKTIAPYQQQLFEFQAAADDDMLWLLEDPSTAAGARNRERIVGILRDNAHSKPEPVPEIWTAGAQWAYTKQLSGPKVYKARFRKRLDKLTRADFGTLVRVTKPYLAEPSGLCREMLTDYMNGFARKLAEKVESSRLGVLAAVVEHAGETRFIICACDAEGCAAKVNEMAELNSPKPSTVECEADPSWSVLDELIAQFA